MEATAAKKIAAISETIKEESKWFIYFLGGNVVNLKNKASGNFLRAMGKTNNFDVRHDFASPGSWAKFTLVNLTGAKYALKTIHKKYLQHSVRTMVTGKGNNIGTSESFQINVCK